MGLVMLNEQAVVNETTEKTGYIQVSVFKVLFMTMLVPFYMWCWLYRGWTAYAELTGKKVNPVLRTLFFVFIGYPLLKNIYASKLKAFFGLLAIWILLLPIYFSAIFLSELSVNVVLMLPFMIVLFCNLSFGIIFALFQFRINRFSDPLLRKRKYYKLNAWNIVGIILAALYWSLLVLFSIIAQIAAMHS